MTEIGAASKAAGSDRAGKMRDVFQKLDIVEMELLEDYTTAESLKADFDKHLSVGEINRLWRFICMHFNYRSDRTFDASRHNDTLRKEQLSVRCACLPTPMYLGRYLFLRNISLSALIAWPVASKSLTLLCHQYHACVNDHLEMMYCL